MNVSQKFDIQSDRIRMVLHLSLSFVNSGDASIPKLDLSSTSDTAGVVTISSPEL